MFWSGSRNDGKVTEFNSSVVRASVNLCRGGGGGERGEEEEGEGRRRRRRGGEEEEGAQTLYTCTN